MSKDNSYIFYSYQWEVDTKYNKINCYCLDQDSNPMIIHVLDYQPLLYITYDTISNPLSLDMAIDYINKILDRENHGIISYNSITMKDSINISNVISCAIIRFYTWDARRHCHNLLRMDNFRFKGMSISVLNTEINDVVLFLSDKELDVCGWIEAHDLDLHTMSCRRIERVDMIRALYPTILSFDIECNSSNSSRMPEPYNLDDKIVMISAISKRYLAKDSDAISRVFVLNMSNDIIYERDDVVVCDTEEHMIEEFLKHIMAIDPVVIVGFNNFGFDIPYIIGRLQLNLRSVPVDISRNGTLTYTKDIDSSTKAYGYMKGTMLMANGRIPMDMLTIYRRDNKLKVRSLDEISRIFLDDRKIDMSPKEMFKVFSKPTYVTMTKIIEYCAKDSMLVLRLIDKRDMWDTWTEESSITFTSMDDLYVRGITHRASNMFYRECVKNSIMIRRHNMRRYKTLGGYVFDPKIGLYNNCTCVDYRSLYPSIIIQHNICVSTYENTTPDGKHIFKEHPRGIIPDMLMSLVSRRNEILSAIKLEQDTRTKSILLARQMSLKLSANGIYGVLSTPYDHILCFSPAAETVTSLGRHYIDVLSNSLTNDHGLTCIYGDTDSCYITKYNTTKDELIDLTNAAIDDINNKLPDKIKIAFEKHVDSMFIISKKKYVLVADGNMIHKGNVSIRKDNCEIVRRLYADVLDMVLIKRLDTRLLMSYILDIYRKIIAGDVDIKDLVTTCPVNKNYRSKSNRYYIMIDRLRRAGINVSVNDRLQYLYARTDGDDFCLQGHKMYTYEEVIDNGYDIDYEFYINKKIHPVIEKLLTILGYKELAYEIICSV